MKLHSFNASWRKDISTIPRISDKKKSLFSVRAIVRITFLVFSDPFEIKRIISNLLIVNKENFLFKNLFLHVCFALGRTIFVGVTNFRIAMYAFFSAIKILTQIPGMVT